MPRKPPLPPPCHRPAQSAANPNRIPLNNAREANLRQSLDIRPSTSRSNARVANCITGNEYPQHMQHNTSAPIATSGDAAAAVHPPPKIDPPNPHHPPQHLIRTTEAAPNLPAFPTAHRPRQSRGHKRLNHAPEEIFRIPFIDRPVYGYGLMLVIGFLAATQLAKFLAAAASLTASSSSTPPSSPSSSASSGCASPTSSRASPPHTGSSPTTAGPSTTTSRPCSTSPAAASPSTAASSSPPPSSSATPSGKSSPSSKGMDIVAPCLMVGLAFGRIGCFFNGCCYGEECSLAWGASSPTAPTPSSNNTRRARSPSPPRLTDPRHPLPNGLPRLLSKEEIRKDTEPHEARRHPPRQARPPHRDLQRLQLLLRRRRPPCLLHPHPRPRPRLRPHAHPRKAPAATPSKSSASNPPSSDTSASA